MEYSVSLALFDFLPVLFAGIGFLYLIRLISFVLPVQGKVALWGSILVLAGGFFKALWKLLMASSGGTVDIRWMEAGLFIFMAPGYILLAWSIWQTARHYHLTGPVYSLLAEEPLAAAVAAARFWFATGGQRLDCILAGETDVLPGSDGPAVIANFTLILPAGS